MNNNLINHVIIVGGGTAGWAAAAALTHNLGRKIRITLVESDLIGTVGVGEASIPPMRSFHRMAGIDEREFMSATSATFKLGIQFENWRKLNHSYIHSFGQLGKATWMADFQHVLFYAQRKSLDFEPADVCVELKAALSGKCSFTDHEPLNYAYHLDATAYARYLRSICEAKGLLRVEGKISAVNKCHSSGHIKSLTLESGQQIEGDFFIDCSGFRALLIGESLGVGYEDWSHWLPVDRAIAVQTESVRPPLPYTRAIARDAGWQWQIPLQHRVGNGHVFSSRFTDAQTATDILVDSLEGPMVNTPREIRFTTGRRLKQWDKNVLSLGLSSGFLEPLESTSIYLMMIGIIRFIKQFPYFGIDESQVNYYNKVAREEFESIRDFIILHYKATERTDTEFWRYMKNLKVPSALEEKITLFESTGHINPDPSDIFRENSWLQVMLGQGLEPRAHHVFPLLMTDDQLLMSLTGLKRQVETRVEKMQTHADFLAHFCPRKELA